MINCPKCDQNIDPFDLLVEEALIGLEGESPQIVKLMLEDMLDNLYDTIRSRLDGQK